MAATYSTSAPSRLASSPIHLPLKSSVSRGYCLMPQNPRFRPLVLASTGVQSPMVSASPPNLSFLDRKAASVLHFVKYHGLGNDFIMVFCLLSLLPCLFFPGFSRSMEWKLILLGCSHGFRFLYQTCLWIVAVPDLDH